ncbi:MAG: Spy/CpxP family protein refolding chaperone [Gemmatimonadaceae bacterium]
MNLSRLLVRTAAVTVMCALPLAAQMTMPDSAQRARLMVNAERMSHPAEYILGFKAELSLTPHQVGLLEGVAKALRDSVPVRMQRMRDAMVSTAKDSPAAAAMAWSGPVDEKAIRAQACTQSTGQVEAMINIVRDRHMVGELLTEEQRAMLPMIEGQAMMKMIGKP